MSGHDVAVLAMWIIIGLTAASLLIQWKTPAFCPECDHCKMIVKRDADKRAEIHHANYHYLTDHSRNVECNDPNCEGRR